MILSFFVCSVALPAPPHTPHTQKLDLDTSVSPYKDHVQSSKVSAGLSMQGPSMKTLSAEKKAAKASAAATRGGGPVQWEAFQ